MGWLAKRLRSLQGFSLVMFLGAAGIAIAALVLYLRHDPKVEKIALRPSVAKNVVAAYLPLVTATLIGFRDALLNQTVKIGRGPRKQVVPIKSGAWVLYTLALSGLIVALGGLVIVSLDRYSEYHPWVLGSCSTIWGATIITIFERYFKEFASP